MIKLFLLIFIFSFSSLLASPIITKVEVNCISSKKCDEFSTMLQQLGGQSYKQEVMKKILAPYLTDEAIESFSYSLTPTTAGNTLNVSLAFYKLIGDIEIKGVDKALATEVLKGLPIKSGDYFSTDGIGKIKEAVVHILTQRGLKNTDVSVKEEYGQSEVVIVVTINVDQKEVVSAVELNGVTDDLKEKFGNYFSPLIDKNWDRIEFKRLQDSLQRSLFDEGYFFSSVTNDIVRLPTQQVKAVVNIELNQRYHLSFQGNSTFERAQLKETILQIIRKQLGRFNERELIKGISDLYESMGVYDSSISLVQRSGKSKYGVSFTNLYFSIREGRKVPVKEMVFIGNDKISTEQIESLFYENATVIASRNLLDIKFLEQFSSTLKKFYLDNGFIFISISEPKVRFVDDGAHVEYEIREGQRCKLSEIITNGIPDKYREAMLKQLHNKAGSNLSVLELPNDFSRALLYIRDQGYYFAALRNANEKSILQYNEDFSEAKLELDFVLERKTVLDSVVVTGNKKTSSRVIQREIHLNRGDILTPHDIDRIWNRLTALGLFSKVEISPFVTNRETDDDYYNVNLLVQVSEVDFGLIEIGPGYRTDLGVKLSANYSYNNVDGMNRSLNLRGQVNRKIGQEGIEENRPKADTSLIEFEAKAAYLEPYLFKIPLEVGPEVSGSRKRYYNFDADIARFSLGASKSFWDELGVSLRYQFEDIRQYNATDENDMGRFRIGGITSTMSLDYRDGPVTPRRGAFFQLSNEYAAPELFSMNSEDLTVKFNKLTARSKFYYPIRKNLVLATSVAWGYQKNLAGSSSYIPSIKVFRLNGIDNVRGYDDAEINVLAGGVDISDVVINDEAYFTNIKIEARHFMNDNTIMGLFIDGGSVNVDHYQVNTLRYSGGLTVKYVTPVGTIDFDYGVKYKRRGSETLGRFHLSIGFF